MVERLQQETSTCCIFLKDKWWEEKPWCTIYYTHTGAGFSTTLSSHREEMLHSLRCSIPHVLLSWTFYSLCSLWLTLHHRGFGVFRCTVKPSVFPREISDIPSALQLFFHSRKSSSCRYTLQSLSGKSPQTLPPVSDSSNNNVRSLTCLYYIKSLFLWTA